MLIAALIAAAAACGDDTSRRPRLDIATTTSVVNSGLLEVLTPAFQDGHGIVVRAHAAGSGRALEMLHDRVVDLVISHAPQAEARMLVSHPQWQYRKIATNEFLIVGPLGDPADVKSATDAVAAFQRIAERGVFVSRGDSSGTHEKEMDLWKAAGATPDAARLPISGAGMGATLRQASERGAYTLTDEATFSQLREQLQLQVVFDGDHRLVNSYAVVFDPASSEAAQFATWLTEGKGRIAIANYRAGTTQPFHVWPDGCPGAAPSDARCSAPPQSR